MQCSLIVTRGVRKHQHTWVLQYYVLWYCILKNTVLNSLHMQICGRQWRIFCCFMAQILCIWWRGVNTMTVFLKVDYKKTVLQYITTYWITSTVSWYTLHRQILTNTQSFPTGSDVFTSHWLGVTRFWGIFKVTASKSK